MKRKDLISWLFSFLLCSAVFAQYGPQSAKPMLGQQINWGDPISKGLVASWLMNEGSGNQVADLSGNGNRGTLAENTLWTGGKFGPCLHFDGAGDYVDCGSFPAGNFGTADFSIVVWAKCQESGSVDVFVAKGNVAAGDVILYKTTTADRFIFYADAGVISLGVTKTGLVGNWIQLAAVRSGSNAYLYANAILIGTDTSAAANISNPHNLCIGGSETGTTNPFIGEIDNVRIWNRALSASEIAQLYREPFAMFYDTDIWWLYSPPAAGPGGQVIIVDGD